MRLTVTTAEGEVYPVQVDEGEVVENVKAIMEVEIGLPVASQIILFNGAPLADGTTLSAAGVKEDDMLLVMPQQQQSQQAPTGAAGRGPNPGALAPDGTAADPLAMMDHIYRDSNLMQQLSSAQPALATAIRNRDVQAFQNALRETNKAKREAEMKQQQELQRLMADPLNPENQTKIQEMINQKNVQEAYENAMEHNPELFGSVIMLYVDMEVNGVKIKAFVDSGAQSTIMSKKCAERLGIMRLCDMRFAGIAKGVGTSKIIGRVHTAPIKVGNSHLTASITILEQDDMEFLFGLDMLKRHQCCIDLAANELRFGSCNESLRFLSEHELPAAARQNGGEPTHQAGGSSQQEPPAAAGAPRPAAAAVGPPSQPAPPAAAADESKVTQLMGLGFSREQVAQALNACGGDIEAAAAILFGGF
eukprot:CAMPEP_0117683292 /NCGR_PEP_ID=MMETSP0804-20121206/20291_1 /TAXON_ID=1074897 /ORGANISM="Tetraselmis astigmatica, Strain CCMP880" /LENGTH=418 /DNA_ID=CAMNT_0005493813 /DNA_START=41 /DNA_END=1297 /DNA_ORIENTATION=+